MAKSIGNIIRELRCARGLTQEQVAESLNVTAQAISKWENNIGLPDISQLAPLAYFFNVSTDVLLGIAEIDSNDEIEKIIKKASGLESYKEEYDALQKALKDFDEIIQPMFAQIRKLKHENKNLTSFRDSLLPKLMSGELDISALNI